MWWPRNVFRVSATGAMRPIFFAHFHECAHNRRGGREGKGVFFYIPNYRKLKKHLINAVFENRVN